MSMMHRRRMVIERAKKLNQQQEIDHGNQGPDSDGQIQERQQSSESGGAEGRQESSPQA